MPAKPAVLILGNFLSAHGYSRGVCEDLAAKLEEAGWQVTSASSKPSRMARLVDFLSTIWSRRGDYQLGSIDTYSGLAFTWAEICAFLLSKLRKPFIMTLHGGNLPEFARRHPLRVSKTLAKAALVTAPSCYLWEQMRLYRADIRLLPNPIDLKLFSFKLRTACSPDLVWMRAFHKIYNPGMAVGAAAALHATHPQLHLHMVGGDKGDGSLQAAKQLAERLQISDHIEFTGSLPHAEVPMSLQLGDIFINTANIDNTPLSVLEAMACGLCVVSTNVGGIPYLLENETDALLVPPDNLEQMAFAVERILTEPGLAERLSRNGRLKAEHFDWSVVLQNWEKLFLEITNQT